MRYLNGRYLKGRNDIVLRIQYVHAWTTTGKSIDTLVSFVAWCLITFCSHIQSTTAQSSAEAGMGATHRGAMSSVFLVNAWEEMTGGCPKIRISLAPLMFTRPMASAFDKYSCSTLPKAAV